MRIDTVNRIVNLELYPIHEPGSASCRELVKQLKNQLHSKQICALPGFLREETRRREVADAIKALPKGNHAHSYRNIYLERSKTECLPDEHPRNILSEASYTMLGAHLLQDDSAMKQLYYWDNFREFVTEVTSSGRLYPSADPYQPVNILCHRPGDKSAWHFDSDNSFTMTLMLQAPERGGEFELVPDIRSEDDPNYDEVQTMLLGNQGNVQQHSREEGELVIFRGCHSAHRVKEVKGKIPRLMCVMVYEDQPDVTGDPVVNETVYGVKAG